MILDCDLSQIEWRMAAFLSQDEVMLNEIRGGQDQHAFTCTSSDLMNLPLTKENRTDAKIFNFRAIYCDPSTAPYAYYMDTKMPDFSQKRWEHIVTGFFRKYAGLSRWHDEIIAEVRRNGILTGPTGRYWKFNKQLKRGGYQDYNVAQIRNYPVQGTSGDVIKLALVIIRKRAAKLCPRSKFIMTVHDSLIWDSPLTEVRDLAKINIEVFREIPQLTLKHFGFLINCPIDGEADFGPTWGQMETLDI